MKNSLLTALALGLLSSSVSAEERPRPALEKKQFARVVASGANPRIEFFYALNPDCTASGEVNVRVTKEPEHGAVKITSTTGFPNSPKESIYFKCNEHRLKGMQINYKSAEKFTGDDTIEVLVIYPLGAAWEVRYDVSVR